VNIDFLSAFHFLRPFWLFGILALPFVWITLRKLNFSGGDWGQSIDPKLLKHLTPNSSSNKESTQSWPPIAILFFALLGLSGPSWEKKPLPVAQLQDDMIVILDLSISMLAGDVAPSRLVRAKQKLQDLLSMRVEGNTSLIVFSGDSHVVTPLTDDINTITSSLAAIDPFIMPVIGSRPDLAIKQAKMLFEQNGSEAGRIILLSDGVTKTQISRIHDTLKDVNVTLDVLAVGTKAGAPIDIPGKGYFKTQGEIVIPQTPLDLLNELATKNRGSMLRLSLDDSDLLTLDISGEPLRETKSSDASSSNERTFDTWIDAGYLIIFILIPLTLFAYRQQTLLVLVVSISFVGTSEPTYAFELTDLFKTNDQKAQELMNQGHYKEAASIYESPDHKATAHYRAGNYEHANKLYNELSSVRSTYNKATSLAKSQKFEDALAAYEEVLRSDPNHEDARFNKALIEQIMEQNQNNDQQDSNEQNSSQDKQESDQKNNQDENQSKNNQSDNDQGNNDESNNDQSNNDQSGTDQNEEQQSSQGTNENDSENTQPDTDPQSKQDQESESKNKEALADEQDSEAESDNPITSSLQDLSDEEKQSYEQWMRRVPDDPSGLLRRKFEQQSYERRRKGGADTLNEGEPVW
jgi:Ca-activated chloride channel family protein